MCFQVLTFLATWQLFIACTKFIVNSKDGGVVVGRSMDFPIDFRSNIVSLPKGEKKTAEPFPLCNTNLSWISKYHVVIADAYDKAEPTDGMNNVGLSVGNLELN